MMAADSDGDSQHISGEPADLTLSQWERAWSKRPKRYKNCTRVQGSVRRPSHGNAARASPQADEENGFQKTGKVLRRSNDIRHPPLRSSVAGNISLFSRSQHATTPNAGHAMFVSTDSDNDADNARVPLSPAHDDALVDSASKSTPAVNTDLQASDPILQDVESFIRPHSQSLTDDLLNLAGDQFVRGPFRENAPLGLVSSIEEGANNESTDDDVLRNGNSRPNKRRINPAYACKKPKLYGRRLERKENRLRLGGRLNLNKLHLQLLEGLDEPVGDQEHDDDQSPVSSSDEDPIEFSQYEPTAGSKSTNLPTSRQKTTVRPVSKIRAALQTLSTNKDLLRIPRQLGRLRRQELAAGDGFIGKERLLSSWAQADKRASRGSQEPRTFGPLKLERLALELHWGVDVSSNALVYEVYNSSQPDKMEPTQLPPNLEVDLEEEQEEEDEDSSDQDNEDDEEEGSAHSQSQHSQTDTRPSSRSDADTVFMDKDYEEASTSTMDDRALRDNEHQMQLGEISTEDDSEDDHATRHFVDKAYHMMVIPETSDFGDENEGQHTRFEDEAYHTMVIPETSDFGDLDEVQQFEHAPEVDFGALRSIDQESQKHNHPCTMEKEAKPNTKLKRALTEAFRSPSKGSSSHSKSHRIGRAVTTSPDRDRYHENESERFRLQQQLSAHDTNNNCVLFD